MSLAWRRRLSKNRTNNKQNWKRINIVITTEKNRTTIYGIWLVQCTDMTGGRKENHCKFFVWVYVQPRKLLLKLIRMNTSKNRFSVKMFQFNVYFYSLISLTSMKYDAMRLNRCCTIDTLSSVWIQNKNQNHIFFYSIDIDISEMATECETFIPLVRWSLQSTN